jgi:hypothetical protein
LSVSTAIEKAAETALNRIGGTAKLRRAYARRTRQLQSEYAQDYDEDTSALGL